LYAQLGEFEDSFKDCNWAILINPCATTYNNRGNAYRGLENFDKAIRDYNSAIELDGEFPIVYCNRGSAYGLMGEIREAKADFEKYGSFGGT